MTEIGETVERVDALIKDTKRFQKLCDVDIERAEEVVAIGKYVWRFICLICIEVNFFYYIFRPATYKCSWRLPQRSCTTKMR